MRLFQKNRRFEVEARALAGSPSAYYDIARFLEPVKSCLQRLGDSFRDLAFDREDVSQFSIVSVGPKMRVGQRVDQLHIHAHLIVRLLHAAFEDVHHTQLASRSVADYLEQLLKCCVDVRETTFKSDTSPDDVRISSCTPSQK